MKALRAIEQKYLGWKGRLDFLRLVKNPSDTQAIFRMGDALKKASSPELIARFMAKAYEDPKFEDAFEQGYWPHIPPFEELDQMPEGSFGRALADFLIDWNLNKDLFPAPNFSSRSDYLMSRVYQAHDAWHVLTGYPPELEGELALLAFGVGQYRQPISLLIICGGLLHILEKSPERAEEALAAVSEGFEMGKRVAYLLTSPVLERLADPLNQVREDLGIEASVAVLKNRDARYRIEL